MADHNQAILVCEGNLSQVMIIFVRTFHTSRKNWKGDKFFLLLWKNRIFNIYSLPQR